MEHNLGCRLSGSEIHVLFDGGVPLSELLASGVYREEIWKWPGSTQERPVYFFEIDGDTIWGATANLLRQLLVTALTDEAKTENKP